MNELIFIAPNESMQQAVDEYRREHFNNGEHEIHAAAWLDQVASFADWLHLLRANADPRTVNPAWVLSYTMCVMRKEDMALVGMVDIHPYLNDFLQQNGGHISFGVRPSLRNRGYGTKILDMALSYCSDMGLNQVMVQCAAENRPAIAVMEKNKLRPVGEVRQGSGRVLLQYVVHLEQKPQQREPQIPLANGLTAKIRPVEAQDAQALAALFRATERESIYLSREPDELRITKQDAAATISQVLQDKKRMWFVAQAGDQIVGRCSVNYIQKRERFMHGAAIEIEVLREHWNKGLGSLMIDLALGWAVDNGYEQIQVHVNALDARTVHVFEKFGFQVVGRIPRAYRYPDATYADMLLMFLQLQ